MKTIYLDNAATSYPKPPEMIEAMRAFQENIGANPGRSGHARSIDAGRALYETREALAKLFQTDDPLRVVLTKNSTEALNIAILGSLRPGDHVVTTAMEHNSVMRPLRYLETQGLELSVIPCSPQGELDPEDVLKSFRSKTRMVVMTHASNVTGTIQPVAEVGRMARERDGVLFCVDAAQTAGALPINVEAMNIDLLAVTGHKSLFGPQGTGALFIRQGLESLISPLMMGGTGSRSEFEMQPDFMPDKYESGTPNTPGFAGLCAGLNLIAKTSLEAIRQKEMSLTVRFLDGLDQMRSRVTVFGPKVAALQTAVVSFTIQGVTPSDAALFFEEEYGILCRPGLHCAPSAHRNIGTFPQGTLRFSFGFYNTTQDVDDALIAVDQLATR